MPRKELLDFQTPGGGYRNLPFSCHFRSNGTKVPRFDVQSLAKMVPISVEN